MPINAGTATPTFRLGTAAVSRMYLGSAQAYDSAGAIVGTGGGTGGGGTVGGIPKPYSLTVVAGDASVVLQFRCATGPTSFQIQYSTNGGAVWTTVPSGYTYSQTVAAGVITGTATIGSLTNGSTYVFRVAGVTASGIGAYSDNSPLAILRTVPTTPTGVTAAVSGRYINLSWTAATGSGPIEYTIQTSTDGGTTWTMYRSRSTLTYATEWPGNGDNSLTPGTSYVFRVFAAYAPLSTIGGASVYAPNSAFSAASSAVTAPSQPPVQPVIESAEPFSGGVVVRFLPPVWDGGSSITSYKVYLDSASTATLTISASDTAYVQYGTMRSFALTGLTNGTIYAVAVVAVNSVGEGDRSVVTAAPRSTIPARLTSFAVTALTPPAKFEYDNGASYNYSSVARAVSITWSATPYAAYTPLFHIQWRLLSGGDWTTLVPPAPALYSNKSGNTIDVLSPNTEYIIRVREGKGGENGPYSYATVTTAA